MYAFVPIAVRIKNEYLLQWWKTDRYFKPTSKYGLLGFWGQVPADLLICGAAGPSRASIARFGV